MAGEKTDMNALLRAAATPGKPPPPADPPPAGPGSFDGGPRGTPVPVQTDGNTWLRRRIANEPLDQGETDR